MISFLILRYIFVCSYFFKGFIDFLVIFFNTDSGGFPFSVKRSLTLIKLIFFLFVQLLQTIIQLMIQWSIHIFYFKITVYSN